MGNGDIALPPAPKTPPKLPGQGLWIVAGIVVAGVGLGVWRNAGGISQIQIPRTVPRESDPVAVPAPLAVLRVYFRPFDDSPASLRQLERLLPLLPRQEIRGEPGTGAMRLVAERLRLDPRQLPNTFALLSRHLYGPDSNETISVLPSGGAVYLPALPLGLPSGNARGYGRIGLRARTDAAATQIRSPLALITADALTTGSSGKEGHVLDFTFPAGTYANARTEELLATGSAAFISNPIEVDVSEAAATRAGASFLTQAARDQLAALVPSGRGPVDLFVVDVDMPDAAYAASIARLFQLCDEIRTRLKMPRVTYRVPAFTRVAHPHSPGIVEALEPLTQVDKGAQVRVTFVPLSKAQDTSVVLEELLFVAEVLRLRASAVNPDGPATADDQRHARTAAAAALGALPDVSGAPVRSDAAILDAVGLVAAAHAPSRKPRYVVNYSWRVKSGVITIAARNEERGLTVVAAGNNGVDVEKAKQDFARRSLLHATFLAVMNLDSAGQKTGGTAFFDPKSLTHARVVGFDGAISSSTATSWAAPRVAWLLAFAEAMSQTSVSDGVWLPELHDRLRKLRTADGPYKSIRPDPVALATLWR